MQLTKYSMGQVGFSDQLKVLALSTGIAAFTGEQPIIDEQPGHTEISFTPGQSAILTQQLEKWHDSEPGTVRVNVKPILAPFYLKKYAIYLGLAALGGLIIGKLL